MPKQPLSAEPSTLNTKGKTISDARTPPPCRLPPALEEIVESHGQVTFEAITAANTDWQRDLQILSKVTQPPSVLKTSRGASGNSDYGFMFDVSAQDTAGMRT